MGQQSSEYATAVETQIEASKVHWSEPSSDMVGEEESNKQRAASTRIFKSLPEVVSFTSGLVMIW
jgi:hypothetical protein